jgi:lysophospholipase L1-like esterase
VQPPPGPVPVAMRCLYLGDSYTKGQGVPVAQSFPVQLTDSLIYRGRRADPPVVIAQTGWRTDQLAGAMTDRLTAADTGYALVTLCIGVNNQYQGRPVAAYEVEFEALLKRAIQCSAGNAVQKVIVLSIPDWAYTPFGQGSNPAAVSAQIDAFNAANRAISERYGVVYIDVTGISRRGLAEPDLVASDRLHPSGRQYTEWTRKILSRL